MENAKLPALLTEAEVYRLTEWPTPPSTFSVPRNYTDPAAHHEAATMISTAANAALTLALAWKLTENKAYLDKSKEILVTWAWNVKALADDDAPFDMVYKGSKFLLAAQLVWSGLRPRAQVVIDFIEYVYLPAAIKLRDRFFQNNWAAWGLTGTILAGQLLGELDNGAVDRLRWMVDNSINKNGDLPRELVRDNGGIWYTYLALSAMATAACTLNIMPATLALAIERFGFFCFYPEKFPTISWLARKPSFPPLRWLKQQIFPSDDTLQRPSPDTWGGDLIALWHAAGGNVDLLLRAWARTQPAGIYTHIDAMFETHIFGRIS